MSMSHRYRNFGGAPSKTTKSDSSDAEAVEDQKLQAFEAGFQAGWDDALKAQTDAKKKLSDELSENLQAISFSHREAVAKVSSSMQPIVQEIVEKLLPEIVRAGLSAHIMEQIKDMLDDQLDQSIEVVVAPSNVSTVSALLRDNLKDVFAVTGDGDIGEGQAFVRIGQSERQVDLDGVVSGVSDAMKAFFHEATQELKDE